MRAGSLISIFTCVIALSLQSRALTKDYKIGKGSTVSANQGDGLIIDVKLASDLAGRTFSLADGASTTFNFFQISTPEKSVNLIEDVLPRTITATLDFAAPDVNAIVAGVTFTAVVDLIKTTGQVTWLGSDTITVADRKFSVSLSTANFDAALLGNYGDTPAWITATVKQISSGTVAVPDGGATLLLLGIAAGALLMLKRKSLF